MYTLKVESTSGIVRCYPYTMWSDAMRAAKLALRAGARWCYIS